MRLFFKASDTTTTRLKSYLYVVFLCMCCLSVWTIKGRAQTETTGEGPSLEFPPKPAALTDAPTIGQPQIEINAKLAGQLGGGELTNVVAPSIVNLLVNSDRFTVTYGDKPQYTCRVTLTDLSVKQIHGTNTVNGGGVVNNIGNIVGSMLKVNNKPVIPTNDADRVIDERIEDWQCSVTMLILNSNRDVIASGRGQVRRSDTNRGVQTDLGGVNTSHGQSVTNLVDLQSGLIELASYYALTNMLPHLDRRLLAASSTSH